jgi:hypothetical protein
MAIHLTLQKSYSWQLIWLYKHHETLDALNQIKSKKSPGLDGISTRLLKDAANIIAGPLVNIFNVSFQRAIFPDDWKLAKVSSSKEIRLTAEITDQYL